MQCNVNALGFLGWVKSVGPEYETVKAKTKPGI